MDLCPPCPSVTFPLSVPLSSLYIPEYSVGYAMYLDGKKRHKYELSYWQTAIAAFIILIIIICIIIIGNWQ